MSHFPLILIPPLIEQAKSAHPPTLIFPDSLPQKPGEKPQKINNPLIAVEVALTIIISTAITSGGGAGLGFLSFVTAAGAIAFQAWQQVKTYPQRKLNHQRETGAYPKKLEDYERKKRQHQEENRASRNPERVAEFQHKRLRDVLSRTSPHDGNGSTSKTGISEAKFGNYLERYFRGKIQTKLKVQNPSYNEGYHYTPDFAYVDRLSNLYIDIEIDEPYVYGSGDPTHFVEAEKDSKRNIFFISKGWLVIRFSEEQVVRHPKSCCKTIASAIALVLGDNSVLSQFANVPNLQEMSRWSQMEAEVMAAESYREKYITRLST